MNRAFLYVISLPSLCTIATWKCLISRFKKDANKRRRIFLSILKCGPQGINSREIRVHLTFSAKWNKLTKFKKTRIHFQSDVFAAFEDPTTRRRRERRSWKWICVILSVFVAMIPTHPLTSRVGEPSWSWFQGTISKFRKRNKIPSLLVYVLHETRN